MRTLTPREIVAKILSAYTGRVIRPGRLLMVEDPGFEGQYAVRVPRFYRDGPQDFLVPIRGGEDEVMDVEFESWPPTSARSLNPFGI